MDRRPAHPPVRSDPPGGGEPISGASNGSDARGAVGEPVRRPGVVVGQPEKQGRVLAFAFSSVLLFSVFLRDTFGLV